MAWLKLNVGGEMFETTRETLTKFPDSQLAKMVESLKDEEVLRLDLDPEYFRPVLNWLREDLLAAPPHLDLKFLLKISVNLGLDNLASEIEKMTKPSLGDWIKLDVGGMIFKTTRATLTQEPDSLLGRMFDPDSSLPPARIQDGAFLIDASPGSFPVILHWLRHRELVLGEVTVETALSAAKYFGLMGLVEVLEGQKWIIKDTDKLVKDADKPYKLYNRSSYRAQFHGDKIPDQLPPQMSREKMSRI